MKKEVLEKNICDTIKEWQIKLGYQQEKMKLYYPADSLAGSLGLKRGADRRELYLALEEFASRVEQRFGRLEITNEGERFCIEVPEEGCAYVNNHIEASVFLREFIDAVSRPACSLEDIRKCFRKFDEGYHYEDRTKDGMGHIFWFEKQEVDEYVYCVEIDEFGATYHRFLQKDFMEL